MVAFYALRELRKPWLELPAENGRDAKRSQIICIHWRVQTVTAKMSKRVLLVQGRDQLCSKTRRRVHREVYGNQSGGANGGFVQRLPGKIETDDFMAALAQPGCGGDQSKWQPPELIG